MKLNESNPETLYSSLNSDKIFALEKSLARFLEVLSRDCLVGKNQQLLHSGSKPKAALHVFPPWHVSHFLRKLRAILHGCGLQKFLTEDLKVQCPCLCICFGPFLTHSSFSSHVFIPSPSVTRPLHCTVPLYCLYPCLLSVLHF